MTAPLEVCFDPSVSACLHACRACGAPVGAMAVWHEDLTLGTLSDWPLLADAPPCSPWASSCPTISFVHGNRFAT